MIATILPKSSNFHAVLYNERKVEKGVATLLVKENISGAAALTDYTPDEMQRFFVDYSSRNSRIRFPQFHAAISCRGHEYSEEELVKFARSYLDEMGYGLPGQPLLIYAHRDTDNTHVHIVTSRVSPEGKKIDHNHERRRSQTIVDRLMNNDVRQKVDDDIEAAWHYVFNDDNAFQCIMQSMGYECFKKADMIYIKRNGAIQKALPKAEVENHFRKHTHPFNDDESQTALKRRRRQLYGIFKRQIPKCSSLDEFAKVLKKDFGVSLVFFGSKDNPTGYRTVDHANKCVFYSIIDITKMQFISVGERIALALRSISEALAENPDAVTKDVNKKLRCNGAYIKDYVLHVDNKVVPLPPDILDSLKANNKAAYLRENPMETEQTAYRKTARPAGGVAHSTSHHSDKGSRAAQNTISRPAASSHTVNRDNEIDASVDKDSLEEQMRRQMKL